MLYDVVLVSAVQQGDSDICIHISHLCHFRTSSRDLCAIQWVLISYLLHTLFVHTNVYMNDVLRTVGVRES